MNLNNYHSACVSFVTLIENYWRVFAAKIKLPVSFAVVKITLHLLGNPKRMPPLFHHPLP